MKLSFRRIAMHAMCIVRRPKHFRFFLAGIKRELVIGLTAASLLGGCTEFMDGYNNAKYGTPIPQRGDSFEAAVGRFATGYAEAASQHGTINATTIDWSRSGAMSTTTINY
jgi:hypothetical protein